MNAAVLDQLLDTGTRPTDSPAHKQLSSREYEIMLLIVRGTKLTQIGTQMFLSVKTVSTYRARILKKLGLSSNTELARYALQHGLID